MNESNSEQTESELFSNEQIVYITLSFIGFWIGINLLFGFIAPFFNSGVSTLWPVGKVEVMEPSISGILIAGSIFLAFLVILKLNSKYDFNLYHIILIGILLIICTNLIHGFWKGFITPTESHGGLVFYWDALKIENPYDFITKYNARQEKLLLHSRTHPPGAVLLYYVFYKIFVFTALISLAILIISVVMSAYFLYKILSRELNEYNLRYITFLFLLIPAIQVYYLANLYAIVTSLFLGVIYYYTHPNKKISLVGTISSLFLVAFLTFMVVFILGVLILFEFFKSYRTKKINNFQKLYIIFICLFLIFVFFLITFRFNYIESLLFASREENPEGFRFFANPFNYFITRVENILEILFFFGPFLFLLVKRGFRLMKEDNPDLYLLTISAFIVLLTLFLAGAYKTGETARACSYIYPFLIFPIAIYFEKMNFPLKEKNKLLILIFAQAIIMQTMGYYKW